MTDFRTMMSQMQLKDIEAEIKQEVAAIKNHGNRMKLAVFLSILTDESFKVLQEIDREAFVNQLREKLEKQIKEYQEKKTLFETHRKQNFVIASNIDEAASGVIQLDDEIKRLLSDYDEKLGEMVRARDLLPLEDLNKRTVNECQDN